MNHQQWNNQQQSPYNNNNNNNPYYSNNQQQLPPPQQQQQWYIGGGQGYSSQVPHSTTATTTPYSSQPPSSSLYQQQQQQNHPYGRTNSNNNNNNHPYLTNAQQQQLPQQPHHHHHQQHHHPYQQQQQQHNPYASQQAPPPIMNQQQQQQQHKVSPYQNPYSAVNTTTTTSALVNSSPYSSMAPKMLIPQQQQQQHNPYTSKYPSSSSSSSSSFNDSHSNRISPYGSMAKHNLQQQPYHHHHNNNKRGDYNNHHQHQHQHQQYQRNKRSVSPNNRNSSSSNNNNNHKRQQSHYQHQHHNNTVTGSKSNKRGRSNSPLQNRYSSKTTTNDDHRHNKKKTSSTVNDHYRSSSMMMTDKPYDVSLNPDALLNSRERQFLDLKRCYSQLYISPDFTRLINHWMTVLPSSATATTTPTTPNSPSSQVDSDTTVVVDGDDSDDDESENVHIRIDSSVPYVIDNELRLFDDQKKNSKDQNGQTTTVASADEKTSVAPLFNRIKFNVRVMLIDSVEQLLNTEELSEFIVEKQQANDNENGVHDKAQNESENEREEEVNNGYKPSKFARKTLHNDDSDDDDERDGKASGYKQSSSESKDAQLPALDAHHASHKIRFLVGKRDRSSELMCIGGTWDPEKDGVDPTSDATLIKTAIRTTREFMGIDLSKCTQWNKFVEIWYHRPAEEIQGVSYPDRQERTLIFVPNVWDIVPDKNEFEQLWNQRLEALLSAERIKVKKEAEKKREEEEKDQELDAEDEMKIDDETEVNEQDENEEEKARKEDEELRNKIMEQKPEEPVLYCVTNHTASTKDIRCTSISLDGLLDYNLDDRLESTFEVSLFAESFHEYLQRKYSRMILTAIRRSNEVETTEKSKHSEESSDSTGNQASSQESTTSLAEKEKSEDGEHMEEEQKEMDAVHTETLASTQDEQQVPTTTETAVHEALDSETTTLDQPIDTNQEAKSEEAAPKTGDIEKNDVQEDENSHPNDKQTVSSERKALLLAFQYFDRNNLGYLRCSDIETLIHGLSQGLSRSFVHHLVSTQCDRSRLFYHSLCSKLYPQQDKL